MPSQKNGVSEALPFSWLSAASGFGQRREIDDWAVQLLRLLHFTWGERSLVESGWAFYLQSLYRSGRHMDRAAGKKKEREKVAIFGSQHCLGDNWGLPRLPSPRLGAGGLTLLWHWLATFGWCRTNAGGCCGPTRCAEGRHGACSWDERQKDAVVYLCNLVLSVLIFTLKKKKQTEESAQI